MEYINFILTININMLNILWNKLILLCKKIYIYSQVKSINILIIGTTKAVVCPILSVEWYI